MLVLTWDTLRKIMKQNIGKIRITIDGTLALSGLNTFFDISFVVGVGGVSTTLSLKQIKK